MYAVNSRVRHCRCVDEQGSAPASDAAYGLTEFARFAHRVGVVFGTLLCKRRLACIKVDRADQQYHRNSAGAGPRCALDVVDIALKCCSDIIYFSTEFRF
ncbi:hypothetical protein APR11_004792 [Nocardia amikacinitolerans]|nr:hypothetical protein [Nocardia amikacinitolerans]